MVSVWTKCPRGILKFWVIQLLICPHGDRWSKTFIGAKLFCTTIRRRLEYGLLEDPSREISDPDLVTLLRQIRTDMPYSGVSMVYESLRARGLKVTREIVWSTLRSIDPLALASRWLAERRPYSVVGPNSLWHIGKKNTSFYLLNVWFLDRFPSQVDKMEASNRWWHWWI